jgi:hypothetical protein
MRQHRNAARESAVDTAVSACSTLECDPSAGGGPGVLLRRVVALLRDIGPYAAIELILPGGSLIALLLWLCRRNETLSSIICTAYAVIAKPLARQLATFAQSPNICRDARLPEASVPGC